MPNTTNLKANLTNQNLWLRLPFMVLFYFLWKLAGFLLLVCILLQTLIQLVKGKPQAGVLAFSAQLTSYSYQVFRYLSFNSQEKPFPFASWPATQAADADPYANPSQVAEPAEEVTAEAEEAVVVEPEVKTEEIAEAESAEAEEAQEETPTATSQTKETK